MSKAKCLKVLGIAIVALILLFLIISTSQRPYIHYYYLRSMSNLKVIGIALWMYAEDHNDVFPDNLEQLEEYSPDSPGHGIFVSPIKPKDFNDPSYVYVSGHSFKDAKSKEKYIIVYENPEYLTGYEIEKINVLYLGRYVERFDREDFISELRATYEHLGREMPEIKFKE